MTDQRREQSNEEIARAAEERRREIEKKDGEGRPDPGLGAFNPVEGVPPHGASIPDRKD